MLSGGGRAAEGLYGTRGSPDWWDGVGGAGIPLCRIHWGMSMGHGEEMLQGMLLPGEERDGVEHLGAITPAGRRGCRGR